MTTSEMWEKERKSQQGRNENSGIKDDKWEDLKKCKQIDLWGMIYLISIAGEHFNNLCCEALLIEQLTACLLNQGMNWGCMITQCV